MGSEVHVVLELSGRPHPPGFVCGMRSYNLAMISEEGTAAQGCRVLGSARLCLGVGADSSGNHGGCL